MTRRILFFYVEKQSFLIPISEKKFGLSLSKRKEPIIIPNTKFQIQEFSQGDIEICYCGIPEFYQQHRSGRQLWKGSRRENAARFWSLGVLLDYLQKCCIENLADAYYLEDGLENILPEEERDLPWNDKQMEPVLLAHYLEHFRKIESLVLIDGDSEFYHEEMQTVNIHLFPDKLLRGLHYFYIVSKHPEVFDELEDLLWIEYGMPVQYVEKIPDARKYPALREIIVDNRADLPNIAELQNIRPRSIYIDLWSNEEKQKLLRGKREDVRYYSEYEYIKNCFCTRQTQADG